MLGLNALRVSKRKEPTAYAVFSAQKLAEENAGE
jgi:hypothetical protein